MRHFPEEWRETHPVHFLERKRAEGMDFIIHHYPEIKSVNLVALSRRAENWLSAHYPKHGLWILCKVQESEAESIKAKMALAGLSYEETGPEDEDPLDL